MIEKKWRGDELLGLSSSPGGGGDGCIWFAAIVVFCLASLLLGFMDGCLKSVSQN